MSFNYQCIFGLGGHVTGLSFEPHIAMLFVTPALFLIPIYYKNNVRKISKVLFVFLIFAIASFSMTNVVALGAILFLIILKGLLGRSREKMRAIWLLIILMLFSSIILYNSKETFIHATAKLNKIPQIETSGGVAYKRLLWLFSPESLFGAGTFPSLRQDRWWWLTKDVGILPSITLLMHLLIVGYFSLKLFFSKSEYSYFGLSIVYLIIHNLKVFGDLAWNQFYIFMLLLLCFHLYYNNGVGDKLALKRK